MRNRDYSISCNEFDSKGEMNMIIFDFEEVFCTFNKRLAEDVIDNFPLSAATRSNHFSILKAGELVCDSTCKGWMTYTTSQLADLKRESNTFSSLTIYTMNSGMTATSLTCTGPEVSNMVNNVIQVSTRNRGDYTLYTCNGKDQLKIGNCMSGLSAICFNCTDPCTDVDRNYTINCQQGGKEDLTHVMFVDHSPLVTAPQLLKIQLLNSTKSTATFELQFSSTQGSFAATQKISTNSENTRPDSANTIFTQGKDFGEILSLTVIKTIHGLQPNTKYDSFWATKSVLDQSMGADAIQMISFHTQCCREIAVVPSAMYYPGDANQSKAIAFHIVGNNKLNDDEALDIELVLETVNDVKAKYFSQKGKEEHYPFLKSRVQFSNTSQTVEYAHYLLQPPGRYCLSFILSGTGGYELSMDRFCFTVLGTLEAPPPPLLQSAMFCSQGTCVDVTFSTPTNRADIEISTTFECAQLFDATWLEPQAACKWMSDQLIRISLSTMTNRGGRGANIGDRVELKNNTIRAKCTKSECSKWSYTPPSVVHLSAPLAPLLPTILIFGPSTIGYPQDFESELVDSSGGGRPFQNVTIAVKYVNTKYSNVNGFLPFGGANYSSDDLSKKLIIPKSILNPGYTYNVVVIVCSFLGACGRNSHRFLVANSVDSGPIVEIRMVGEMRSANDLNVQCDAYIMRADGSRDSSYFTYIWSVYRSDGGEMLPHLGSESNASSSLYLPPHSLAPGFTYTLLLRVFDNKSGKSSTASKLIYIATGGVVARSNATAEVSMNRHKHITIDGGLSYDTDIPGKAGTAAGLTFMWYCEGKTFGGRCEGLNFACSTSSICRLSMKDPTVDSYDYSQYIISFNVRSESSEAKKSITVIVYPPSAPIIENLTSPIIEDGALMKGKDVVMHADVATWHGGCVVVSGWGSKDCWSPSPDGFLPSHPIVLVLNRKSIHQDKDTFMIEIKVVLDNNNEQSDFSTRSSILVVPNSKPQPGKFEVYPQSGMEMSTTFLFLAPGWTDDDLPLWFSFYDCSPAIADSGWKGLTSQHRLLSRFETSLGAGPDPYKTVGVTIYDSIGAESEANTTIQVVHNPHLTTNEIIRMVEESPNEAIRGSFLSQAIDVLNWVNCSGLAGSMCREINRENCGTITNTCGKCRGGFDGQMEPANTMCYNMSAFIGYTREKNGMLTAATVLDHDRTTTKACHDLCSQHGTCQFISHQHIGDGNASSIQECNILDDSCRAQCICKDGFEGLGCEQTTEEFNAANLNFESYLKSWEKQIVSQHPHRYTVIMWAKGLSGVAPHSTYLSEGSKRLLMNLCFRVLEMAKDSKLSYDDLKQPIEKILDISTPRSNHSPIAGMYRSLLRYYPECLLVDNFYPNQEPEIRLLSAFRMYAASFNGDFTTPATTPWSLLRVSAEVNRKSRIFVVESPGFRTDAAQSTPAMILVDENSISCETVGAICLVNVTFLKTDHVVNMSKPTFNTTCSTKNNRVETMCPTGMNMAVTCPENFTGTIMSTCSHYRRKLDCESLSGGGQCTVVSSTEGELVCQCPLAPSPVADGLASLTVSMVDWVVVEEATMQFYSDGQDESNGQNLFSFVESPLSYVTAAVLLLIVVYFTAMYLIQRHEGEKHDKGEVHCMEDVESNEITTIRVASRNRHVVSAIIEGDSDPTAIICSSQCSETNTNSTRYSESNAYEPSKQKKTAHPQYRLYPDVGVNVSMYSTSPEQVKAAVREASNIPDDFEHVPFESMHDRIDPVVTVDERDSSIIGAFSSHVTDNTPLSAYGIYLVDSCSVRVPSETFHL
jgi:hypothetical protein